MLYFFVNNSSLLAVAGAIFLNGFLLSLLKKLPLARLLLAEGCVLLFFLLAGFRAAFLCSASMLFVFLILTRPATGKSLLFLLLLPVPLFLKTDSSAGRFFILKNTFEIIRNNPEGIGMGKFRLAYPLQQAEYFKRNDLNSREALLADNVESALNEYVQCAAEFGVTTGFFLLAIQWAIFYRGLVYYKKRPTGTLLFGLTVFSGICTAALFFNVLHNWWLLALYVFCVGVVLFQPVFLLLRIWYFSALAIAACCLVPGTYNEQCERKTIATAVQFSFSGYRLLADSVFKQVQQKNSPKYQQEYGAHLLRFGLTDSAYVILQNAAEQNSNYRVYCLLGDIAMNRQDTGLARYYYEMAVYMVPARLSSRLRLVNYYRNTGNWKKELYWL
ncbi:MAG: O-antigen ligase family protein, partial [Dinghuibacter sp.]|nr:O-antigen ligase family protein [Dinghuibacter sp.]